MDQKRLLQLREFQKTCGLLDARPTLLNIALTHPSYAYENAHLGWEHNQRLEFLGDAVLGLVVGAYLYLTYPHKPEGDLTKIRAAVVCEPTLAKVGRELGIGKYLLLGRGEEMNGGRERPSILADAVEAVIGAFYLSVGLAPVQAFILGHLEKDIAKVAEGNYGDYKTALQELVQKQTDETVNYRIIDEYGPDHDKRFVAGVVFRQQVLGQGVGRTKKEAEQKAARAVLEREDLVLWLRAQPKNNE